MKRHSVCVYLYILHVEDQFNDVYQQKEVIHGKQGPFPLLTYFFLQSYCILLVRFRGLV